MGWESKEERSSEIPVHFAHQFQVLSQVSVTTLLCLELICEESD